MEINNEKADYHKQFLKLADEYFESLKLAYTKRIDLARKKHVILDEVRNEITILFSTNERKMGEHARFMIEVNNEADINNTKEIPQIFNEKFDLIEDSEKENTIIAIANYSGTQKFMEFWSSENKKYRHDKSIDNETDINISTVLIKKMTFDDIIAEFKELIKEASKEDIADLRNGFGQYTMVELLKRFDRKSDKAVEAFYNQAIVMLNSQLELRTTKEKIEYINNRRKAMFEDLENEQTKGINHVLDMEINKIPQLYTLAVNFLPDIKEQLPVEISDIADKAFVFENLPIAGEEVENPKEKVDTLLQYLHSFAENQPALAKIITAKRPIRTAIAAALYLNYDKKYLLHLNETVDNLENPPIEIKNNPLEKIVWQGTQKELAELFVELERKGWIKEKKIELIKAYFTKSDTIHQVLKPSQDSKSKEKTYDGIYTSNYKGSFDQIKPIKTHVK